MGSMKPSSSSASRYNSSFYSTSSPCRSSTKSDPSSSTDRLQPSTKSSSSRALIKAKTNGSNSNNNNNFSAMVKKFMETKPASNSASRKPQKGAANDAMKLVIAADIVAENLKNGTGSKKATPLSALHKKLFKGSSKKEDEKSVVERKALTEVKGNNTRTLAMVLRSERELLNLNKEQDIQISELKLMLEDKNREVDRLKDLCLKQREEIKSLKSAILFPDVMNSQLQELVEKQGSELKQAKQLIPSLQMQVTSLTGQLQCLADDLAEVKADKYSMKGCRDSHSSPRTPGYDQEEAANSLQFDQVFSSGDQATPGSPDDLFLKDLNPCLTPYYAKTKSSKDFEECDSTDDDVSFTNNSQISHDHHRGFNSCARKLSKSSDCCQCSKTGSSSARDGRRSDERKMHIWSADAS